MTRYGSDVIVDLLREAGIEHVALNPGATFRGIHDSLVQRDDMPQIVLCQHEAVSVAVAQGYAKAAGRPMAVLLHDVVGLQNAAMAIYNAWCDRVPMLLIGGTGPKSKAKRRPWIDWIHTAAPQAAVVRDYVKWDDEPHDLASVPESFARGLGATRSLPSGPVYLCYDVALQEDPVPDGFDAGPELARYPVPSAPVATTEDVDTLAEILRSAERPVLLAGHAGEAPGALDTLAELAERLGAPVVDTGVRLAFPTDHPLCAAGVPGVLDEADVVLALDVEDLRAPLGARMDARELTVMEVGLGSLRLRGWSHDYQQLAPSDRQVTAAADGVVAGLAARLRERGEAPGAVQRAASWSTRIGQARTACRRDAAHAEGDGMVPLERLVHEVGRALDDVPYLLANGTNGRLEHRHWDLRSPRQYLGSHAGGGLGYGVGAAIGAALAAEPGTITVDIQADGDLLYLPSALWTAAHLSLPILVVVHNNRQYGNTVEHAVNIARHRGRDTGHRYVGAGLDNPPVDLAALARSFGVWAAGPIADTLTLADRLAEAVAVVRSGRPALVDVLTPGF